MKYSFLLSTCSRFLYLLVLLLTSESAANTLVADTTEAHDQLTAQPPVGKCQEGGPSVVTTTYTVHHTVVIPGQSTIAGASSVEDKSTISGPTVGGPSLTRASPDVSGADRTTATPLTTMDPHSHINDATAQNAGSTSSAHSPGIPDSPKDISSAQRGGTSQQEPVRTSVSSANDQNSDSSIVVVPPPASIPTPSDSAPDSTSPMVGNDASKTASPTRTGQSPSQEPLPVSSTVAVQSSGISDSKTRSNSEGKAIGSNSGTAINTPTHPVSTLNPNPGANEPDHNPNDSTGAAEPTASSASTGAISLPEPHPSISTIFVPTTVDSGSGTTVDLIPIATTIAPSTATGIRAIPESLVLTSVSSMSSVIGALIPMVQSWEASPTARSRDTFNHLADVNREIDDLITGLGGGDEGSRGSSPGCGGNKKRALLDGVTDIFNAAVDAFNCIGDVVKDIADNINAGHIAPVAGLLDTLAGQLKGLRSDNNNNDDNSNHNNSNDNDSNDNDNNDNDNNDNDNNDNDEDDSKQSTTSTESTSSAQTTSTCTETTALQVTVKCKPMYSTHGSSIITTTTCAPSTTNTVTGCSVTPTTTTVTKEAVCRPKTTSQCVETTAPQVTVVCRPRYQTHEGSITTTTTCAPSKTFTVTGCSVTPSTITVTEDATCRPRRTKTPTSTTFATTTTKPLASTSTSTSTTTTAAATRTATMTTTTQSATVTVNHSILPPFPTFGPSDDTKDALCFRNVNQDHRYQNFSADVAGELTNKLCLDTPDQIFSPDDSDLVQASLDGELLAWMRWAEVQSGCPSKRAFPYNATCVQAMLGIELNCDLWDPDTPGSFGGGWIANSDFGCLEFGLVRDKQQ